MKADTSESSSNAPTPVPEARGHTSVPVRVARLVGTTLLVSALAWGVGLIWFAHVAMRPGSVPPSADGIVALTGGAGRIEVALQLLESGRGRLLLVSGVSHGVEFTELARRAGVDPEPLASRVTMGRDARSTFGNATETASWARSNDLHSLIVVTAGYHMARALTEIRRALPEVRLYPDAVMPPALRGPGGFSRARLLAAEYTKWLLVRLWLVQRSG